MPRCGAEARILRNSGVTTMNINVSTQGGNVDVSGAVIFRVLRGEWHPIDTSQQTVVMHTETNLPYSQMDLVVKWPPQGGGGTGGTSLFLPANSGVDPRALDGLGTLFGIAGSQVGLYSGSNPHGSTAGIVAAWNSYSCLLGDELPDGSKLTEAIMRERDGTPIRGGWVFAEPDGSQPAGQSGGEGGSEAGTWLTLSPNRFAVIGGKLGALFGAGRRLYFESGVDDAFRSRVRSEFGFAANEGEDAYIRVEDFGYDFLLEVTPE